MTLAHTFWHRFIVLFKQGLCTAKDHPFSQYARWKYQSLVYFFVVVRRPLYLVPYFHDTNFGKNTSTKN